MYPMSSVLVLMYVVLSYLLMMDLAVVQMYIKDVVCFCFNARSGWSLPKSICVPSCIRPNFVYLLPLSSDMQSTGAGPIYFQFLPCPRERVMVDLVTWLMGCLAQLVGEFGRNRCMRG